MIKCMCLRACTVRPENGGKAKFYSREEIDYFLEVPKYFVSMDAPIVPQLEGGVVDVGAGSKAEAFAFGDAPEELLLEAEYDIKDLKKFCEDNYRILIHPNTQKQTAVQQFVDARLNAISIGRDGKLVSV